MKSYVKTVFLLLFASLVSDSLRAQTTGSIDTGFGQFNAWATFDGTISPDVQGRVVDLKVLPDGKVLGLLVCKDAAALDKPCLVRWNANGASPDTTFGSVGRSIVSDSLVVSGGHPRMTVRPDGRIVVAWRCSVASVTNICVAVVNENGIGFDGGFGAGGESAIPPPAGFSGLDFADLLLRGDGSLLIAATCESTGTAFCVTRLLPNGFFDNSFASSAWSIGLSVNAPNYARPSRLNPWGDGGFTVTGQCRNGSVRTFCGALYAVSGSSIIAYDASWLSSDVTVGAVRTLGNQIVVSGATQPGGGFLLAHSTRFDGFLADTSYGGTYPTTATASFNIDSSDDGNNLAQLMLRDGGILFHGDCNSGTRLCTARLNAHGVLDTSYGSSGRFEYNLASTSPFAFPNLPVVSALAEHDRWVYAGGSCMQSAGVSRPCVRRYVNGTSTTPACTMDIDGDGRVLPATDGLLLARAMLGLKGAAVLSGAAGVGATRTSWADVLFYLNDQCKMNLVP